MTHVLTYPRADITNSVAKAILRCQIFIIAIIPAGGIEMTAQASHIQELDAISITLLGEARSDGSVLVRSPDLPLFSAVGGCEREALDNAMSMLGPYLAANVPDYVDLRKLRPAPQALGGEELESLLPAHVIACRGAGNDGHRSQ
jgi:hypothetical protein